MSGKYDDILIFTGRREVSICEIVEVSSTPVEIAKPR